MPDSSRSLKVAQGQETASRLLNIARSRFAAQGFAATTTEEIIALAGVTKGALYHHYPSKLHLFEAVYRQIEDEIAERIQAASSKAKSPWDALVAGCFAYLEASADPGLRQILRVDGPAALGLERWAAIDREYGVDRLIPFLQALKKGGVLKVASAEAFAWQLTGAMNEATFWIASHSNRKLALAHSKTTLNQLLESVRDA